MSGDRFSSSSQALLVEKLIMPNNELVILLWISYIA